MQFKFWFACLSPALLFIISQAHAADNGQPPLFEVKAEQQLPDARGTFDEIRKLILENYYTTSISENDLYQAAINGMLRHISPPQDPKLAKLWLPAEYERIRESLVGLSASLGVKVNYNAGDGSLTVNQLIPGSAATNKLRINDRIMRIDGQKLSGKSATEIQSLLNGKPGSKVLLSVVRDIELFVVELERKTLNIKQIEQLALSADTAYLQLKSFTHNIHQQMDQELKSLKKQGVKNLIIDLRGNSGGIFLEGLKTAELFLPPKTIMLRTLIRPEKINNYVSSRKKPYDFKLAILSDKHTASSSEVFISALTSHNRAKLIGDKTNGKATVEKTFTLKNDYKTKFIVGALYDAKGRSWHVSGIQPDFYVSQPSASIKKQLINARADIRLKHDQPLATAYKLLTDNS